MRKILLTAVAVLALSGSANARANRVPGDVIGWVKSADVDCDSTGDCILVDNYTDAHKHGAGCAVWGLPVYSRPNGKPIGVLVEEAVAGEHFVRGEQHQGYTLLFFDKESTNHSGFSLSPYDAKSLHICG
jgi:hypothetical protein